jgi:hypothetical protein
MTIIAVEGGREGGEKILKTREMGIGEEVGDKLIREVMRNRRVSN